MHLSVSLLLVVSLAITLGSADHIGSKRNHAAVEFGKRGEIGLSLFKRDSGAQFTFYQDGLGACGKTNKPSDFIVALNSQQFNGGAHCFETITITVGGKTNQATVVDECMGCGYNNLDFSQGLFDFFGSESAGVLHGSWSFGSGDSNPSPPTPKAKAPAKASPKSSSKAPPTSTKDKTSSSSTKHATTHTSTSTPTPSVAPNTDVQTASALASQEANASNLYAINMAFMGLSGIVASA